MVIAEKKLPSSVFPCEIELAFSAQIEPALSAHSLPLGATVRLRASLRLCASITVCSQCGAHAADQQAAQRRAAKFARSPSAVHEGGPKLRRRLSVMQTASALNCVRCRLRVMQMGPLACAGLRDTQALEEPPHTLSGANSSTFSPIFFLIFSPLAAYRTTRAANRPAALPSSGSTNHLNEWQPCGGAAIKLATQSAGEPATQPGGRPASQTARRLS